MDCLFCRIISNDIPSYTIYEDKTVRVFLDIDQKAKGNMLIIPRKHYQDIMDIDLNTLKHMIEVSRDMYKLLKDKLSVYGVTIIQNNSPDHIGHYHIHLTPIYKKDNNKKLSINDVFEILTK